jgi:hypothetical protein
MIRLRLAYGETGDTGRASSFAKATADNAGEMPLSDEKDFSAGGGFSLETKPGVWQLEGWS